MSPDATKSSTRLLTWNVERAKPSSARGSAALEWLFSRSPDVAILTESSAEIPDRGGHLLECLPHAGRYRADDRKVMMWSARPWRPLPGFNLDTKWQSRAVWGTTATPFGDLSVLGVCIPWHMAGRYTEPKQKPWATHLAYLEDLLVALRDGPPIDVIAGDFNQYVPRIWGPKLAAEKLKDTLEGYGVITEGTPTGCTRPGIDHLAISSRLQAVEVFGWPADPDGRRLSDHEGAGADLELASTD